MKKRLAVASRVLGWLALAGAAGCGDARDPDVGGSNVEVDRLSGPSDCPAIGDSCDDETIFVGYHPVSGVALFMHPQGFGSLEWGLVEVTGATDENNGRTNQDIIESRTDSASFPAFQRCREESDVGAFGHSDWYLPARVEYMKLRWHRDEIEAGAADDFSGESYWVSTEVSDGNAHKQVFVGNQLSNTGNGKTLNRRVRCIRRDEDHAIATRFCDDSGSCWSIGDLRDDGTVFVGLHPVLADPLFLHPRSLPDAVWSLEAGTTGATHILDGRANQDWITAHAEVSSYPMFATCRALNATADANHGRYDWYVPSGGELGLLWAHRQAINPNMVEGSVASITLSSTEIDADTANQQDSFGIYGSSKLNNARKVLCLRRGL